MSYNEFVVFITEFRYDSHDAVVWRSLQERSWLATKEFSGGWGSLECLVRAFASRELDNSFARTSPKAGSFVSRQAARSSLLKDSLRFAQGVFLCQSPNT